MRRPSRLLSNRSSSLISIRVRAYSEKFPRWHWADSSCSAAAESFFLICLTNPITARSAWNWAKDDSRLPRARSLPKRAMRFIDMLYVGVKEERSGYVRVDASPAAVAESTVGDHCTTALPSISIPRRPARPVSWVYSPGVIETCASPFHFVSFSKTTVRAGILIPSAKVSVAKTALTRPRLKRSSTAPLKLGNIPAWWAAIPRSSAVSQSR